METGWEKLKDRREKHKLVQFYKMTKIQIEQLRSATTKLTGYSLF
jgi:hypothetical protein